MAEVGLISRLPNKLMKKANDSEMSYKRVLTIQDISCVGQCSLTVALPILSACGVETCVLPSAVLSSHTGGFTGVHFRDLTEDMPAIREHWQREGIAFDAISTGYLGSVKQIEYVRDFFRTMVAPEGLRIMDPAMADHGKLYKGFGEDHVKAMRTLCADADILIPNLSEACMLTGTDYCPGCGVEQLERILGKLTELGPKCIVLTGIGFRPEETGAAIWEGGKLSHYAHLKQEGSYHGTGDIFAAAFTGACMQAQSVEEAARMAADFTALCIEKTRQNPAHWYGVKFEQALPELIRMLGL